MKKIDLDKDKIDSVYCYYFPKYNAIYIGRTIDVKRRDREHRQKINDSVRQFSISNNCEIPPIKIIEEKISVNEGAKKECFWIEKYKELGYKLINKCKGGSKGGTDNGKWDYNSCLEIAKKCFSSAELEKMNETVYKVSLENKWIKKYTWFKPKKRPKTYKECFFEAKKYKTKIDFEKNSNAFYAYALNHNWIKDYKWFIPTKELISQKCTKWTYEECFEEAKKYKTKKEFYTLSGGAYKKAILKGWINDYTWFEKPFRWTEENALEAAKKCSSKIEYKKRFNGAYHLSRKNGWLNNYTWFKKPKL